MGWMEREESNEQGARAEMEVGCKGCEKWGEESRGREGDKREGHEPEIRAQSSVLCRPSLFRSISRPHILHSCVINASFLLALNLNASQPKLIWLLYQVNWSPPSGTSKQCGHLPDSCWMAGK